MPVSRSTGAAAVLGRDRGRPDDRVGRPIGPFIGALIFVFLRTFALDFLREIGLDGNRFRLLIGLGFLVIVFWSPDGVIGLWERWRRRGAPTSARPAGGAHG